MIVFMFQKMEIIEFKYLLKKVFFLRGFGATDTPIVTNTNDNDGDGDNDIPTNLRAPWRCAIDSGSLYVADADHSRICVYACQDGSFLRAIPMRTRGHPTGLCIYQDSIYITADSDQISVYSTQGQLIQSFGESGSGSGQFSQPTGINVDDLYIYVADCGNDRIEVYTKDWKFSHRYEDFSYPHDLTSLNGYLYIGDRSNVITVVSRDKDEKDEFGKSFRKTIGKSGTQRGEFREPFTVTSSEGRLYVAEDGNHRIQVLE